MDLIIPFEPEFGFDCYPEVAYGGEKLDLVVEEKQCEFFPEVEMPSLCSAEEFETLWKPKNLLGRKRKSEDWDSKPLEKRGTFVKSEFNQQFIFDSDSELDYATEQLFDTSFFEQPKSTQVKAEKKNASNLLTTKQKRTRWDNTEVRKMWTGIAQHGNNWRAINKNYLKDRTYYQVKDKGRRLLASEGWISGRSKSDIDDSSDDAKALAVRVNKRFAKADKKKRR